MDWATKDGFFKAKVPIEEMDVPGIGRVKVHGLGLGEKEEWEQNSFRVNIESSQMKISHADAQLLMRTVHDRHGKRLFAGEDMGRLLMVPAANLEPVLAVARRLSAIGKQAVKELVKNLQDPPGEEKG